ncbi:MAG: hypothetical protein Q8936_10770 [Bacillota bacterium]|nr:hypothetical protein [Bacillota bacterium]
MKSGVEKMLWSIAIPGFGQLLNKKYFKGTVLIILEFIININANINEIIVLSFLGFTDLSAKQANYKWLMFYPCVYLFSIWDAYKDGVDEVPPLLYIPFATAAYSETLGIIYSKCFRINGILIGPIFLPTAFIFLGLGIGFLIRLFILNVKKIDH